MITLAIIPFMLFPCFLFDISIVGFNFTSGHCLQFFNNSVNIKGFENRIQINLLKESFEELDIGNGNKKAAGICIS